MSSKSWEKLATLTGGNDEIKLLVKMMCMESFQKGVDRERKAKQG